MLALVKGALWGFEAMGALPPCPSAEDWAGALRQCERQTVAGITLSPMGECGANVPASVLMRWAAIAEAVEQRNHAVEAALEHVLGFLYARGLVPVLLKGQSIAQLYREPLMRQSGDIDLYVQPDQWAQARNALEKLCGCAIDHADGSYSAYLGDVEIEVHSRVFDIYTRAHQKVADELMADEGTRRITIGPKCEATVLAPASNLLMQSTHIMKHAMGHGVGLRQLCDYALTRSTLATEELTLYHSAIRRLRLTAWQLDLDHAVEAISPGAPNNLTEAQLKPGLLLARMLADGNFGDRRRRSKAATVMAFAKRLPKSLHWSAAETLALMLTLVKGQRK